MLLEYFTRGTVETVTGSWVGIEVETDFVDREGFPISTEVTKKLLECSKDKPEGTSLKLELGRQKIEASIAPQPTATLTIASMQKSLEWLYQQAEQLGAYPSFAPEMQYQGSLLWVQEERDEIWVNLDGKEALEELCRCSSVQFTVDVHPSDAINVVNRLHAAKLHERDYAPNHQRWLNYISKSAAAYLPDRYGGPSRFTDLEDYAAQLAKHDVVMHQGLPTKASLHNLENPDIDLFLRSIWWHYRLRRYGNTLAVEMRPFARRGDGDLLELWKLIAEAAGF